MSRLAEVKNKVNPPTKKPMPTTIQGMLGDERFQKQLAAALPKHMTPERMGRIALTEIRKNPMLGKCDPMSLFAAVVQSAQLGLEVGSGLGHAYLVPFNDRKNNRVDVQFIPGYRGFLELAWRSGKVKSIHADVVYEADEFDFAMGLDTRLTHVPNLFAEDRGPMIAAYCVLHTTDGGHIFKVVGQGDINKAKANSKAADSKYSPWQTDPESMWMKTAVRRLFKFMPVSVEIQKAVTLDEATESANIRQSDLYEVDLGQAEVVSEEQSQPEEQGAE